VIPTTGDITMGDIVIDMSQELRLIAFFCAFCYYSHHSALEKKNRKKERNESF
jgi:hypothetical protein